MVAFQAALIEPSQEQHYVSEHFIVFRLYMRPAVRCPPRAENLIQRDEVLRRFVQDDQAESPPSVLEQSPCRPLHP